MLKAAWEGSSANAQELAKIATESVLSFNGVQVFDARVMRSPV
ncbi:hypothetical protein AK972_3966 [Pseudomonas yamanorum]|nr:hypothetical protein AK972_3966 [Pseudomonas yamanorum]